MVARANSAVKRYWMCDEGRFTYKPVHENRVVAPLVAGASVDWDRALDEAARLLRAGGERGLGGIGVVFSAQSTNEDLYALARLAFEHLKVERAYLTGKGE